MRALGTLVSVACWEAMATLPLQQSEEQPTMSGFEFFWVPAVPRHSGEVAKHLLEHVRDHGEDPEAIKGGVLIRRPGT